MNGGWLTTLRRKELLREAHSTHHRMEARLKLEGMDPHRRPRPILRQPPLEEESSLLLERLMPVNDFELAFDSSDYASSQVPVCWCSQWHR